MKVTNKYNLPEPYFKSCLRDSYPRFGWDTFSVTELMKGTKEIILNRRHWAELEQDCADMVWTIFGTAVHNILSGHEGENQLAEERLKMAVDCGEFGTRYITGEFDLYDADTQIITDYKTAGVFTYKMRLQEGGDSDWLKQLRTYWLILGKLGFPVKDVRNTVFLKDWSKTQARRDSSYPQKPIMNIDYGFNGYFNSEEASYMEADIIAKITEILRYKDAEEHLIPDCTAEQRWERDEHWAVMKRGRKTALKRHDSEALAQHHLEALDANHYVEHRPGLPTKCVDYCTAAPHCSFYQNYIKSLEDTQEAVNE